MAFLFSVLFFKHEWCFANGKLLSVLFLKDEWCLQGGVSIPHKQLQLQLQLRDLSRGQVLSNIKE
jgi:hypothetical protein